MKYLAFIIALVCCLSCKERITLLPLPIDVREDIVIPKHYIVGKTDTKIIIDGKAEEASWDQASFTDNFIDIEGIKNPKYDTRVKMLWDDDFLYVYTEMEEPHVWGYLKQRDTIIYYNNDFEVFIDPFDSGPSYGEIELNALNTVWDLFLSKPYRAKGKADFTWNLDDLKTAVNINGTLNDPSDVDTGWTVEMAIPLQPFVAMKQNSKTEPKDREQWRINFSRVNWDHDIINGKYYRKKEDDTFLKEYNWVWSNQKVINMHEPEKWGYLQFTNKTSSDDVAYLADPDLLIKQSAFALFRKTRYGELQFLLDKKTETAMDLIVIYEKNKEFEAQFNKTETGFEYTMESPITNTTYVINQEGNLKTL